MSDFEEVRNTILTIVSEYEPISIPSLKERTKKRHKETPMEFITNSVRALIMDGDLHVTVDWKLEIGNGEPLD